MKLLIISDTHGDTTMMERVIQFYKDGVDAVIHCGDSELSYSYFKDKHIHVVRGNCDLDKAFPNEEVFQLANEKVFVVHGHKHQIKSSLMSLHYRALEEQATIVCFGHSHLIGAELNENILYVNPGSLYKPRGRKEKSYAIVEKLAQKWVVLFFSADNHEIIDQVHLECSF